ncbi:MAG: hypothetical protein B7X06_00675, partial [Verrucomicrobia bacterium 21-51-4]
MNLFASVAQCLLEPRVLLSATWNGAGSSTNWSEGANWTGGTAPTSPVSGSVNFNNQGSHLVSNNDLGPVTTDHFAFLATTSNDFTVTGAALIASGGLLLIQNAQAVTLNSAVTLQGSAPAVQTTSGTSTLTINGVLAATNDIDVATSSGSTLNFVLGNSQNTFTQPITFANNVHLQVATPTGTDLTIPAAGTNSYLGQAGVSVTGTNSDLTLTAGGALSYGRSLSVSGSTDSATLSATTNLSWSSTASISLDNGATLTLTPNAGGDPQNPSGYLQLASIPITFGVNGGTLNVDGAMFPKGGNNLGPVTVNSASGTPGKIVSSQYPGIQPTNGAWGQTFIRLYNCGGSQGTGLLEFDLTNGALAEINACDQSNGFRFVGVDGGDVSGDSLSHDVGRFAPYFTGTGVLNIAGVLEFENAMQVNAYVGSITIANAISVVSGQTAFSGRTSASAGTLS